MESEPVEERAMVSKKLFLSQYKESLICNLLQWKSAGPYLEMLYLKQVSFFMYSFLPFTRSI